MNKVWILTLVCCFVTIIEGPISSRWKECGCHWEPWAPWSACTETCSGGIQQRDRKVWVYDKATNINCGINFTVCATNDMGFETQACNTVCYGGGVYTKYSCSSYYGYCNCQLDKRGSCCEETVTCGTPSRISHGHFVGNSFNYGNEVTYICDNGYNMTTPSRAKQTCTQWGYWRGTTAKCQYAISCNSSPCQNRATCVNGLGFYICVCGNGWTGKHCETDIQPPVLSGCPANMTVYVNELHTLQNWTVPRFADPMDPTGNSLRVTTNYNGNSFNFTWGDFTINYVAVKRTNGLQTQCRFTVSVGPHPCPTLAVPEYGAIVCNGWRTEYARNCFFLCLDGYTYPPGYSSDIWYICGASGSWMPLPTLKACVSNVVPPASVISKPLDCRNTTQLQTTRSSYILALKMSKFNQLCEDYQTECSVNNVDVKCYQQM